MILRRIALGTGPRLGILSGFNHTFTRSSSDERCVEPICLIGDNGSGKSKLLECLAEIFYTIDNRYREFEPDPKARVPFTFELDYHTKVAGEDIEVRLRHGDPKRDPVFTTVSAGGEEQEVAESEILGLIPQYVVGYTSGENETLSVPFAGDRQHYSEAIAVAAVNDSAGEVDVPDSRMVMMDYDLNLGVAAACFLLEAPSVLKEFEEQIRISGLHSFRLVVRFNHQAAKRIKGVKRTDRIDRYVENLKKCSTCWDYDEKEEAWLFDFLVNAETKKAFKKYFLSPYALFRAFQRLEMLNELMISKKERTAARKMRTQQKVVLRPPVPAEADRVFRFDELRLSLLGVDEPVDYISLSDGEHQFLHVFGTLMIFDHESILFLLDEPESHFNPKWRIHFVSTLQRILKNKGHCLLLTTHAPFVPSDTKSSHVYVFKRDGEGRISMRPPTEETFGASFDRILQDVFGIKPPPVARGSLEELQKLQRSDDPDEIERRLADFGDSMEKFALYERIEELRERAGEG